MAPLTLGAQQGQAEDKPKRTFLGMRGGGLIRKWFMIASPSALWPLSWQTNDSRSLCLLHLLRVYGGMLQRKCWTELRLVQRYWLTIAFTGRRWLLLLLEHGNVHPPWPRSERSQERRQEQRMADSNRTVWVRETDTAEDAAWIIPLLHVFYSRSRSSP